MIFRKTMESAGKKISKIKLTNKLKKQYNFSKDQIAKIFSIWGNDIVGLKDKIKKVESCNNEVSEYTAMGNEIGAMLYDALVESQK